MDEMGQGKLLLNKTMPLSRKDARRCSASRMGMVFELGDVYMNGEGV